MRYPTLPLDTPAWDKTALSCRRPRSPVYRKPKRDALLAKAKEFTGDFEHEEWRAGMKDQKFRALVAKLIRDGLIERVGRGVYRVVR